MLNKESIKPNLLFRGFLFLFLSFWLVNNASAIERISINNNSLSCFSQDKNYIESQDCDTLVFLDNSEIVALIKYRRDPFLYCKNCGEPDGKKYRINTKELKSIKYHSGRIETLSVNKNQRVALWKPFNEYTKADALSVGFLCGFAFLLGFFILIILEKKELKVAFLKGFFTGFAVLLTVSLLVSLNQFFV